MPNTQPTKIWSGRFHKPLDRPFGRSRCVKALAAAAAFCAASGLNAQSKPAETAIAEAPAIVTFYSNKFTWSAYMGGKKTLVFRGHLFADHQLLTYLGGGNFISFTFTAGIHDFAADTWLAHKDAHGAHLVLYVAPGEHDFIELRTPVRKTDILYQSGPLFAIDNKTCTEARKGNSEDQPVDPKHLTELGATMAIAETAFPDCPSPTTPTTVPRN